MFIPIKTVSKSKLHTWLIFNEAFQFENRDGDTYVWITGLDELWRLQKVVGSLAIVDDELLVLDDVWD